MGDELGTGVEKMGSDGKMMIAVVTGSTGRMEKMSLDEDGMGVSRIEATRELTSTVMLLERGPGGVAMEEVGLTDTVTVTVSPESLLSGLFQPKRRAKRSLRNCSAVRDRSPSSISSKKSFSGVSPTCRAAEMSEVDVATGAGSATALAILATSSTIVSERRAARELEGDMIAAPT